MKNIKSKTIGVVGFGHLGSSIVQSIINRGFSKDNLMISYRGNKNTYARTVNMGVDSCLTGTENIMKGADIIILAARPQDLRNIAENDVSEDALVISFMAALPLEVLNNNFNCNVCRVMCSGPETITAGRGAYVLFPEIRKAEAILELAGIKRLYITSEDEIDAFTVGICVPSILMNIIVSEEERKKALFDMRGRFPLYDELGEWIEQELACGSYDNKQRSLENVSTKGGISEAMIMSLKRGDSFACSMNRGMERCFEIRSEICVKMAVSAA